LVGDDEILLRRVRIAWVRYDGGTWHLTSQAFNDVGYRPSVDRHSLRLDASICKHDASDGVASIVARDVRAITSIMLNPNADRELQRAYLVDVIARPIVDGNVEQEPENLAHAQVETQPGFETRSRFDKLKDALCRLAQPRGWVIEPSALAE
jgi:hypothetical protein